ncbi:MAG: homoprotocatechuate degradation operon regulator HpaR [Gammaproteobacteria bacterium]|nr:homoprotocatechuate degradation operon regulator HpaR [Gammaproteobacteria bacterium]
MAKARMAPAPGLRDFRHSLPMELLKAREAAMARFRPLLKAWGFTEQQWRVIRALADSEPMDARQLASRSLLLAPSLTRILRHLENEGMVRRSVDGSDQRRQIVSLTDSGRQRFEAAAPDSEAAYARIESDFGRERLERLYRLLAEFHARMEKTKPQ